MHALLTQNRLSAVEAQMYSTLSESSQTVAVEQVRPVNVANLSTHSTSVHVPKIKDGIFLKLTCRCWAIADD